MVSYRTPQAVQTQPQLLFWLFMEIVQRPAAQRTELRRLLPETFQKGHGVLPAPR